MRIRSRDISAGGVGFETGHRLPLNSDSRLLLWHIGDLPQTATIEGRVVHSTHNPITRRYAVGVQFTQFIDVTPEQLLASITTWEAAAEH